jgi:D-sedoheptulose 7-phosphate isomerase
MDAARRHLDQVRAELDALRGLLERFPRSEAAKVVTMAEGVAAALAGGNAVFTCGNGGSAADAQHIAGELVGRFRHKVRGYHASALTTNSSIVTALANDYSFDEVFSRQLESMARRGDVLLALSTSGESANLVRAVETAKGMGVRTFAFSGKGGGALAGAAELAVVVPHDDFARIQEVHMTLGHILCGLVEEIIQPSAGGTSGARDR